jgi:pseudouridine-5'-monophosphatase
VISEYGKVFDWSLKRHMIGRDAIEASTFLIESLGLPLSPDELIERQEPILDRLFRHTRVMPGAPELVADLRARGVPMAVATSSRTELYEKKIAGHSWFTHFRVTVTGDDPEVHRLKPSPDIFLVASSRLGVAPEECLVVEDSPAGVEAGRRAHMRVIGLPAPELGVDALPRAHVIARDYGDVRRALFEALTPSGEAAPVDSEGEVAE